MRGRHVFCANMHQRVPYGKRLITPLNNKQKCSWKSACAIVKWAPPKDTLVRTTLRKQVECCCIYRNCYQLFTKVNRRKGSVMYGLGADISLPECLATGIWILASKATSGPKSRGASFDTTLWHHVQATVALVFFWRYPTNIRGENIYMTYIGSTKYNTPLMSFTGASFFFFFSLWE